jgi:hypothetical protein
MRELVLENEDGEVYWVGRNHEEALDENLCTLCGHNRARNGCVALEEIDQLDSEGVTATVSRCKMFEPVDGVVSVLEREGD